MSKGSLVLAKDYDAIGGKRYFFLKVLTLSQAKKKKKLKKSINLKLYKAGTDGKDIKYFGIWPSAHLMQKLMPVK